LPPYYALSGLGALSDLCTRGDALCACPWLSYSAPLALNSYYARLALNSYYARLALNSYFAPLALH